MNAMCADSFYRDGENRCNVDTKRFSQMAAGAAVCDEAQREKHAARATGRFTSVCAPTSVHASTKRLGVAIEH